MDELKSVYDEQFKEFMLNSMGLILQKLEKIEKIFDSFDKSREENESANEIK